MSNYNIITTTSTPRIQRFGKGGAILRSNSPLSDDAIRQAAPSIFADGKHDSRSIRYTYIPTSEVLGMLRKEGFQPFSVQQGGSGDEEKRAFTKHMIRLRHESALDLGVGSTFREIVLVNSHDGTSTYQLTAGLFRLVCLNGMVVGEGLMESVRVKHVGDVGQMVIEGCYDILQRLPEVSESVREMNDLTLSQPEREALARAALIARYDDPADAPIEAPKLLALNRRDDAAPTLWNTLNTVQENIIKGGTRYVAENKNGKRIRRQTREIRGIDQNVGVNRALWTLAEEMKKIKAQG